MSAFTCSKKHYENVKTSLEHFWATERDRAGLFADLFWPRNIDHAYDQIDKAVKIWEALNFETVIYKYEHEDYHRAALEIEKFWKFQGKIKAGKVQDKTALYKLIQCIHYQIELEHIDRQLTTPESEAIALLNRLCNELPRNIVTDSESYKQADWAA